MTANVIEQAAPAWPGTIREEFEANQLNGRVGTRLLSETDRVRVWTIRLKPGERIAQLVVVPVVQVELEIVTDFAATARGAGGSRSSASQKASTSSTYRSNSLIAWSLPSISVVRAPG